MTPQHYTRRMKRYCDCPFSAQILLGRQELKLRTQAEMTRGCAPGPWIYFLSFFSWSSHDAPPARAPAWFG